MDIEKLSGEELDREYRRELKAQYREELNAVSRELAEFYEFYDDQVKRDKPPVLRLIRAQTVRPEKLLSKMKWLNFKISTLEKKGVPTGTIGEYDILRAKEHPFENLIEIGRGGMVRCPFHEDKSPSMLIKNGFAYCFSCQKSWDTIAFVMESEGLNFVDAVKRLN